MGTFGELGYTKWEPLENWGILNGNLWGKGILNGNQRYTKWEPKVY